MSDGYDVFISYRRDSGAAEARLIRLALMEKGKRVFLDVTDLRSGYFDETILSYITQAPNFVLVLSPGSLDRTGSEDDWFRREIVQSLKTDSNIVPVLLPGFTFPPQAQLPEELWNLPRHQGVDYSHRYFEAMIGEIVRVCDPASERKRHAIAVMKAKAEPEVATPVSAASTPPAATRTKGTKLRVWLPWIILALLVVAVIPSLVNLTYQKFYADDPLITYTTWRYDGDDWMPYIDFRPGGDLATHVDYDKEKSYGGHWSQSGNRIRFEINYGETYRNEQEVTVSGDQMSGTASAPTGLPWWHPLHRGSSKEIKLHRLDPRSVSTDAPSLAGTTWAIGGVGESGAIGFLAGGKFQDLGGNWTQDGRYVKFEVDKDGVVDKYTVAVSGDRMHGDVEHSGKVVGGGRALLFRVKRSDVQ